MRGAIDPFAARLGCVLLPALLVPCGSTPSFGQGALEQLRDDVRRASGGSSSSSSRDDDGKEHHHYDGTNDHDDHEFSGFVVKLGFVALTSPWWGPHASLGDSFHDFGYFPRFPYDHVPGYMMSDPCLPWMDDPACGADPMRSERWPTKPRTWAARLRTEYADEFNDLSRIGWHFLLTTRSRFGLDTETNCFEEKLPGDARDRLWLGDCNVVFRFAQSQRAQFRTGLGFNWLDDPIETNFGFNFTYGADFFPRRPWILSATIDWGTLGEAELFRFRTTGGVIVYCVEVYTGYEYLDVDSLHTNALMGGVRIWF